MLREHLKPTKPLQRRPRCNGYPYAPRALDDPTKISEAILAGASGWCWKIALFADITEYPRELIAATKERLAQLAVLGLVTQRSEHAIERVAHAGVQRVENFLRYRQRWRLGGAAQGRRVGARSGQRAAVLPLTRIVFHRPVPAEQWARRSGPSRLGIPRRAARHLDQ